MKKVSLLGFAGLAPAVVGFIMPASGAAATPAQHPGHAGKTVSLKDRQAPQANCPPFKHFNFDSKGIFSGFVSYSKLCVTFQEGILYRSQTGLTERVRFYSGNGTRESTRWLGGTISFNRHETKWTSSPFVFAHQVCQALVANGNHADVKYGPVCEFTS